MVKDNTALYIGGGLLALLLLPNILGSTDEESEDALGGFGGLDLSNLFGDISLGGEGLQGLIPNLSFDLPDFNLPDISGAIQSTIDTITGTITDPIDALTENISEGARTARYAAGLGIGIPAGAYAAYVTRGVPSAATRVGTGILETVSPRLAANVGARIGLRSIPILGWLYTGADVGVTAYELISGRPVAGAWLGQGELFGVGENGEHEPGGTVTGTPTEALTASPGLAPLETFTPTPTNIPVETPSIFAGNPMIPPFVEDTFNMALGWLMSLFGGTRQAEAQGGLGIAETLAFAEAGWGIPEQSSIAEPGASLVYSGAGTPSISAALSPIGGVNIGGGYSMPSFSGQGEAGEGEGAIAWA